MFRVSRVGKAVYPCAAVGLGPRHWIVRWERMQGARRRPWWLPRASRATPQTPHRTDPLTRHGTTVAHEQTALPTLRDRADFPSCGVVASLLGYYPTSSAPPHLSGKSAAVAATWNTQTGSYSGFGAPPFICAHSKSRRIR